METERQLTPRKSGLITGLKTGLSNYISIINQLLLVIILLIGLPS